VIFRRINIVLLLLFFLIQYSSAFCQNIPKSYDEKKQLPNYRDSIKKEIKKEEAKELVKTEKFLKKLKKKLSFISNIKAKEKKRIDAVIKKYVQDANLLSGADVKKVNDSLAKITNLKLDSIGKLISSISNENKSLSQLVNNLKKDIESLSENMPESAEEIEMDKLADKLIPLIKEKAKEEEIKELKDKKIKIIREIIAHPQGLSDTLQINDSISKTFTLKLKKKEVFGFHPYWRNIDYYRNYNFSVLSSLVYYGYELDPKTGLCKDIHDWDKQKVTDFAKKEKCKVYLGVFCESERGVKTLLGNENNQELFFNSIIEQLKLKNADGVNLIFGSPDGKNRLKFLKFVKAFRNKLISANSNYKITLTIPIIDQNFFYDIKGLESDIEYFILDFTKKNIRGPIVPITGSDYSLEAGLSRYLSFNVPPEKFIACFPYHGVVWDAESTGEFLNYIAYSDIEEKYTKDYGYSYDNNTARTDVVFDKVDTLEQLWFDDAKTLSDKYDYVLDKNLAGVGVWALGDDGFKTELWDALLNKLIIIDTTDIKEIKHVPQVQAQLTFWQKIKMEFRLYRELFQHPCDFETSVEYLDGKQIRKRDLLKADDYIFVIVVIGILLLALVGAYSIYMNRTLGDDWTQQKLFLILLIILTIVNVIFLLMFFFLDKNFGAFGAHGVGENGHCEVKLTTLLKLLGIGFILGGLATRFLVIPLIKRKETP
jgi:hypothetical protein